MRRTLTWISDKLLKRLEVHHRQEQEGSHIGIVNLFVEKKIIDELKRGKGVESRGICNRSNHFEK